jgi:NADPH:quinone reductase-like Zn-dependent oxidoreductase/SAM-dependent methyltransferase
MLAVAISESEAIELTQHTLTGIVSVACVNSPDSATISGDESAIDEIKETLDCRGVFNRKLKVDTAYHSHHMKKVSGEYLEAIKHIVAGVPRPGIKFFSSVTATQKDSGFDAEYWIDNLVSKVRFSDGLQELCQSELTIPPHIIGVPANIFVEIGAHSALAGPVRQILTKVELDRFKYVYCPTLVRNKNAVRTLLDLTSSIFDIGHPVDLVSAMSINRPRNSRQTLINLPSYPWDHSERYWAESRMSQEYRFRTFPYHDLLGLKVIGSTIRDPVWRSFLGIDTLPWLRDHVVDGVTIFPGTGYLCMAVEAQRQVDSLRGRSAEISNIKMRDIIFSKALIIPSSSEGKSSEVEMQISFKPLNNTDDKFGWNYFRVESLGDDGSWSENCSGSIISEVITKIDPVEGTRENDNLIEAYRNEMDSMKNACTSVLTADDIYGDYQANGNSFGPTFRAISGAKIDDRFRGLATVVTQDIAATMPAGFQQPHLMHPATVDSMSQLSIALYRKACTTGPIMPTSIDEVYVSTAVSSVPGTEFLVAIHLQPESRKSAKFDVSVWPAGADPIQHPIMTLVGARLRSVGEGTEDDNQLPFQRKMSYRLEWKQDLAYAIPKSLNSELPFHELKVHTERIHKQELAAALLVRKGVRAMVGKTPSNAKPHLNVLFEWMTKYSGSKTCKDLIGDIDGVDAELFLTEASQDGVEGEMLSQIGQNLHLILTAEMDSLEKMLENNLLTRFYASGLCIPNYKQLAEYFGFASFKNPHMNFLEIGAGTGAATAPLIKSMKRPEGLLLNRYCYSDISSGFFEQGRDLFADCIQYFDFKTLDISRDPIAQGFLEGSFDVIIASNVLHATPSISVTLSNARKLLKPGGKLCLVELTRPTGPINAIFGTLPGWWLSEDGREDGPLITRDQWNKELLANKFNGVEFALDDVEGPSARSSLIVSTAVDDVDDDTNRQSVIIICISKLSAYTSFAAELNISFSERGMTTSIITELPKDISLDTIYFIIDVVECPLLFDLTSEKFQLIRQFLTTAQFVFWVSAQQSTSVVSDPRKGPVIGMRRAICRENSGMKFVTFDIQQDIIEAGGKLVKLVTDVLLTTCAQTSESNSSSEEEFTYRDGDILLPRSQPDWKFNDWVSKVAGESGCETGLFHQVERPLKLEVETPGLLNSLRFVDHDGWQDLPLGPDEVEIEARAYGVNFKDIFVALGQMLPGVGMTGECSGIIKAVGINMHDRFQVGDRVGCLGATPFSSRSRISGDYVYKLPDYMSYIVGASIPAIFLTAYYSLVEIAHLKPGQSVLIQAASGGVGQAAIMIAQYIGCEIFATVGSVAKHKLLVDHYSIPSSHIYSSRSKTFKAGIRRLTKERGVDVVLNSLSGDWMTDSLACVAPLGTFVEIGKADIYKNAQIDLRPFDKSVTFAAFDLTLLCLHKPHEIPILYSKIIELFDLGKLSAVEPINRMEITNIEDAFRLIQSRRHTGKVVVECDQGAVVKVVSTRPSPLRLNPNGTYIIAGGLGDLGRKMSSLLAKHGAGNIVTLSRRTLDPETKQSFEKEIESLGAKLHILKCDITDDFMISTIVSHCRDLPPVRGVIHGGMVLQVS